MRLYSTSLLIAASIVIGLATTPAAAMPINLIINGDFESDVPVMTELTLNVANINSASTYAIVSNPHSVHGAAASYGDNTPGAGNVLMMAINGSDKLEQIIWSQEVSVSSNTVYDFAADISSWFAANSAELTFNVNSDLGPQQIGMLTAPSDTGVWVTAGSNIGTPNFATWTSGATTTMATLSIRNRQIAHFGNDFALDNIYFGNPVLSDPNCCNGGGGTVPEPGTLALLGVGALMLRRRASSRT